MVTQEVKKTKKAKKPIKIWKSILGVIFAVLAVMLGYLLYWSQDVFGDIPFAQVLFHLMVPLKGADNDIVASYFEGVMPYVTVMVAYLLVIFLPDIMDGYYAWKKKLKEKKQNVETVNVETVNAVAVDDDDDDVVEKEKASVKKENLFNKIIKAVIEGVCIVRRLFTRYFLSISSLALVIVIVVDIFGFHIDEWLADRFDSSTIFEDYYVDAAEAKITAPENGKKKNLIFILCESLEASFADVASGGCMNENLIPNLTNMANENTHFSTKENLAGAIEVEGTGWTIAAMVAQLSGVPMMTPMGQNGYEGYAKFLPGLTSLGELLEKQGYVNEVMLGSYKHFAGVDTYFEQHGNYEIFDYSTAVEYDYIDQDYFRFWGFEDDKLLQYAKTEIDKLEATGKPFNLLINTIDLHTTSGYTCERCGTKYPEKYKNVINCQDALIYEFVEWCKTQDFYEDTVIVVGGDHLSMAPIVKNEFVPKGYDRSTYHVIINSDLEPTNAENRLFTTMDMYPTILASLGFKIEGERLGLGTNLYSDKKTVMEEVGKEYFMEEISKNSILYNEDILGTK